MDAWSNRSGFRTERELTDGAVLARDRFPGRGEVAWSPRLSLVYAARERLLLRGALYRAFRAPTINELYRPFRVRNDITAANAGLDPEVLTGAELGLDVGAARPGFRLTVFWNRGEDAVANVTWAPARGPSHPAGSSPRGASAGSGKTWRRSASPASKPRPSTAPPLSGGSP